MKENPTPEPDYGILPKEYYTALGEALASYRRSQDQTPQPPVVIEYSTPASQPEVTGMPASVSLDTSEGTLTRIVGL